MTSNPQMRDHEVFENVVASVVDVSSVMVAYTIGITQSSIFLGLAYGIFDAIIVVWLRKPISRFIRRVITVTTHKAPPAAVTRDVAKELVQAQ